MSSTDSMPTLPDDHITGKGPLSIASQPEVHDESISMTTSDPEKTETTDPRAHVFLGMPMSMPHEVAFFIAVSTANFIPHSGFHQALCILSTISEDLDAVRPGQRVWLMAGYGLTVGTFILLAGRLGDVYGYKCVFMAGNIWLGISSALAGASIFTSHRYVVFLLARLMQGIGPALCIPNAVALLGVTYVPGPRKSMMFALFGAMAPASAIISPLFASLLAMIWWPWAFWALGLVSVLIAVLSSFVIPDHLTPDKAGQPRLADGFLPLARELDLLGAATGVTGLTLISIACNQGAFVGWSQPYVSVLLAVGICLCIAFVVVEKHATKPLIPVDAVNVGVAFVLVAVFCGWGCFGIWIYYVWQFYEVIRGACPLLAVAWHSPILVCGIAAAVTTGLLIQRAGPAVVMALALSAFTIGTTLIATAPADQTYWAQTFFSNVIITWGMDLSFPAATLMLSDLVVAEHQGIAASLVTTVVNYSGALALGVAGAVEMRVTGDSHDLEDLLRGYRSAWYVAIGFGVTGLLASLMFVRRYSGYRRSATTV